MRIVTVREYDHKRGVPVPGLWRRDIDSKDLLCLRQAGESVKSIAALFGVVKSTVCERLKKDFPKQYKTLRVIPSRRQYYILSARAYKLYQELESYRKVAKAMGCARSTVINRVRFMKEVLGEKGRMLCEERRQDMALYPAMVVGEEGNVSVEGEGGLDFERTFPSAPSVPGIVETAYGKDILDDIEVAGNGRRLF